MDKSILEMVHEEADHMHETGHINKQTMREYDALCLPEVPQYTPAQIKKIRIRNNVSQAIFAQYLNTGVETVRKWEAKPATCKKPNGAALKLINLIDKHGLDMLA